MKITKIKVGLGNTCGPKFEPIKCYIEIEAEADADKDLFPVALQDLKDRVAAEVWKYCYEELLVLKGGDEAHKFKEEHRAP